MAQPKIELSPDYLDKYLFTVTILFGLFLVGYPLLNYGSLPSEIPIHFSADGTPDRFGSKVEIWMIPIIGILLAVFLNWLARIPHTFNYAVKITPENAAEQYLAGARLVKILATIIIVAFAYIIFGIVQAAKGQKIGLSAYFLPILSGAIFLTIGYFLSQSFKKEK